MIFLQFVRIKQPNRRKSAKIWDKTDQIYEHLDYLQLLINQNLYTTNRFFIKDVILAPTKLIYQAMKTTTLLLLLTALISVKAQNLITNGNFESGTSEPFTFYREPWNGLVFDAAIFNRELAILNISQTSVDIWRLQVIYFDLPVENGVTYKFSFDTYADSPRTIRAYVCENGNDWTMYVEKYIQVTTEKTRYEFIFKMLQPTDPGAELAFDLAASTASIYFDNISLEIYSGSLAQYDNHLYTFENGLGLLDVYPDSLDDTLYVTDNPFRTKIDTSSKVLQFDKDTGNMHFINLKPLEPIVFNTHPVMLKFKVLNVGNASRIYTKLISPSGNILQESWAHDYDAPPAADTWVPIAYDISALSVGDTLSVIALGLGIDNPDNAEQTNFLDDIQVVEEDPEVYTFENGWDGLWVFHHGYFGDPNYPGDTLFIAENPDNSDINISTNALKFEKDAGNWHYVNMIPAQPLIVGDNNVLRFKVYNEGVDSRVYPKLLSPSGNILIEGWAHDWGNPPPAYTWVEILYDISSLNETDSIYNISIALGVDNEDIQNIYLDDIELVTYPINHQPTIDVIGDQELGLAEIKTIELTGISDGDGGTQPLTVSATSSDESVVQVTVEYTIGNSTAVLRLFGLQYGTSTINVYVYDGGTTIGGGSNMKVISFLATVTGGTGISPTNDDIPSIYPNPADDYFLIRESQSVQSVEILTLAGNAILECKHDLARIDISGLSKGIYLVKLNRSDGSSCLEKIIKK
jgi:hypothetical protein